MHKIFIKTKDKLKKLKKTEKSDHSNPILAERNSEGYKKSNEFMQKIKKDYYKDVPSEELKKKYKISDAFLFSVVDTTNESVHATPLCAGKIKPNTEKYKEVE